MELENKKSTLGLVFVAIILSLGLIISSIIVTGGIVKIKSTDTIYVKGSAKQQIKSDMAIWKGRFIVRAGNISDAYKKIKDDSGKVKKYLIDKKIPENNITFSSITTNINYKMLPDGNRTNEIENYTLEQYVEIKLADVKMVSALSREATELIEQEVEFQSDPPQYLYTKLADLKIDILAKSTEDAKKRAEKIVQSAGSKVGRLKGVDMGVLQITPLYSTEVSDYGVNDTTSIDKEITAVVRCTFEIK